MFGFGKGKQSKGENLPEKPRRKYSCITDKPLSSHSEDRLSAQQYSEALFNFIVHADTPVTIGVQGGWGSGKTSLIFLLGEKLAQDTEHRSLTVFINAWEHSLFQSADNKSDVALSILSGLTDGIKEAMEGAQQSGWLDAGLVKSALDSRANLISNAVAGIKTGLKFGGAVALQMASNMVGGGDVSKVKFQKNSGSQEGGDVPSLAKSVHNLRKNLTEMIEAVTRSGKPDRIVFFIDDLDRVSPPTAVEILDITKNIFDIPNCIFVVSIDYEVVVKGLKEKYGEKTESNEREFRQYFDKIIQIPFTMPIGAYASHIQEMLRPALARLGYNQVDDDYQLINNIAKYVNFATNGTPRSIKRIINTLSLLEHIAHTEDKKDEITKERLNELEIRVIIVSLLVSYPEICRRIMKNSDFTDWKFCNLEQAWKLDRNAEQENLTALEKSEFFNDEWEKVLYCLCAKNPWLRDQAQNISLLMNSLREVLGAASDAPLPEEAHSLLEEIIAGIRVVSIDTETATQTIDDSSIKTDRVTVFCQKLHDKLYKKYPEIVDAPDNRAYCKRNNAEKYREYFISTYSPLSGIDFIWKKKENIFEIDVYARGKWKTASEGDKILEKAAGKNYSFGRHGKVFCLIKENTMEIEDFTSQSEENKMTQELYKICNTVINIF